ncbi:hypothetical protein JW979_16375, partial [bacterium]|nr:hypothetical protein [candidate division CSSED10-310 bacterium]
KVYLPLPRDLGASKEDIKNKDIREAIPAYPLGLCHKIVTNSPLSSALIHQPQDTQARDMVVEYPSEGAFIHHRHFKRYLEGEQNQLQLHRLKKFVESEPKIGIARNAETMATEEGHLYRINMLRLKIGDKTEEGFSLLVEAQGIEFTNSQGVSKLGGENKLFSYKISEERGILEYDEDEKQELITGIRKADNTFKLYFAMPTIWESSTAIEKTGWRAAWMNLGGEQQSFIDQVTGKTLTCQLLTAAVGNYQNVGGWEIVYHRPKRMYRAVPAGSVYYLKLVSGQPEDVIELFHNKNLSDCRAQEGFGLAYVGAVSC